MEDEDMMMAPFTPPRRVTSRSYLNTEYKIRIARPITEIDDFDQEIAALEEAEPNSFVYVQVSSPGGSLETCDFLCNRMDECRAPIVAEIGFLAASAASALVLHADDWVVNDSSVMMVHAASYSPGYGRESEIRTSVSHIERINREWVERTYQGFLSDEQLAQVLDGKDLYFYADDLREMLPKYKEYRDSVRDCDDMEEEFEGEEGFNLLEEIDSRVATGVEKALEKVLSKYDLVPKNKPTKPSRPKVVKVVDEKIVTD